ncbi:hypothetical protein U9M48_030853 [Paspalum notatum var. saurae]|uniref:Uncharacterized protein n=1 Tax=Paspalum notatum var. saurae TaxID=547442 RepID=A0AAQ3X452_PASNO
MDAFNDENGMASQNPNNKQCVREDRLPRAASQPGSHPPPTLPGSASRARHPGPSRLPARSAPTAPRFGLRRRPQRPPGRPRRPLVAPRRLPRHLRHPRWAPAARAAHGRSAPTAQRFGRPCSFAHPRSAPPVPPCRPRCQLVPPRARLRPTGHATCDQRRPAGDWHLTLAVCTAAAPKTGHLRVAAQLSRNLRHPSGQCHTLRRPGLYAGYPSACNVLRRPADKPQRSTVRWLLRFITFFFRMSLQGVHISLAQIAGFLDAGVAARLRTHIAALLINVADRLQLPGTPSHAVVYYIGILSLIDKNQLEP